MSVQFDATVSTTPKLQVALTGIGSNGVTVGGWYYHTASRSLGRIFNFALSTTNYVCWGFGTTANQLRYVTTGPETAGATLTVNNWYYVAQVWTPTTGTDDVGYHGSLTAASLTALSAANGDTISGSWVLQLGNDAFNSSLNGRLCNVKLWNNSLTAAEVQAERWSWHPQRTTDLWGWWPLDGNGNIQDYSGNGRNLTLTGSPTEAAGPPVAFDAPVRAAYTYTPASATPSSQAFFAMMAA
jgi:hypothetical protein